MGRLSVALAVAVALLAVLPGGEQMLWIIIYGKAAVQNGSGLGGTRLARYWATTG